MGAPTGKPGGEDRELTASEAKFLAVLLPGRRWLDVWRHSDADGTPWLIVSLDISDSRTIIRTLRLDFDGSKVVGRLEPG